MGEVEAGELGAGEVGAGSLAIVPGSAQPARPRSRPAAGTSSDSFFIIAILALFLRYIVLGVTSAFSFNAEDGHNGVTPFRI
jgi:hypothetical protein